ncbi:cadherin repeat domain-containing protein [Streptococcus ictaluri]|nr:hypothetical protein [Streptococcus ictaluri]
MKVTFYDADGKTVLKTKEVASLKGIQDYQPKKSGKHFEGWYLKPDLSRKLMSKAELRPDMSLFAGFSEAKEDTRDFVIVGNGSSDLLKASNWGGNVTEAHQFKKEWDGKVNTYTLTAKLAKDDEFQFAKNGKWEHQRGFGYLASGDKDGETYLSNSSGLGDVSLKQANIKVAKAGTYRFTLITHPADDQYDTNLTA